MMPTLPHPHIPALSGFFIFRVAGITLDALLVNQPDGPEPSHTQLPDLSSEAVTMAKRMQDKESIAGMSWLVLLIIACWGGLVRYLIDVKQSKATWSLINALAQMVVSGFTGVIAGLVSIESGLSIYMILATAGISGAMGSVALTYFWERLTGIKDANQ